MPSSSTSLLRLSCMTWGPHSCNVPFFPFVSAQVRLKGSSTLWKICKPSFHSRRHHQQLPFPSLNQPACCRRLNPKNCPMSFIQKALKLCHQVPRKLLGYFKQQTPLPFFFTLERIIYKFLTRVEIKFVVDVVVVVYSGIPISRTLIFSNLPR